MDFPIKQMLSWKAANIGPTLIGFWYLVLPWLATKSMDQSMMLFGFTFLSIGLIRARSKPTVLGCLFAMFIGLAYFFTFANFISMAALWIVSLVLFAMVLVFELGIFKFGPTNAKAKVLTIVPLAVLSFSLLLGVAGYNPLIHFNWTSATLIAINYIAIMLFGFLYVLDYAGWRPLGSKTGTWLNLLAIAAVALSAIGLAQGSLFAF
jgi:hypothetical protein